MKDYAGGWSLFDSLLFCITRFESQWPRKNYKVFGCILFYRMCCWSMQPQKCSDVQGSSVIRTSLHNSIGGAGLCNSTAGSGMSLFLHRRPGTVAKKHKHNPIPTSAQLFRPSDRLFHKYSSKSVSYDATFFGRLQHLRRLSTAQRLRPLPTGISAVPVCSDLGSPDPAPDPEGCMRCRTPCRPDGERNRTGVHIPLVRAVRQPESCPRPHQQPAQTTTPSPWPLLFDDPRGVVAQALSRLRSPLMPRTLFTWS